MPKRISTQEGFSHLLLIIAGLVILSAVSSSVIPTVQEFPKPSQSVLGEDEEIKQEENHTNNEIKKEEVKANEEIKREDKKISEDQKKIEEIKREEAKKINEIKKEDNQKVFELQKINRFAIPQKVTRVQSASESGKTETEIETTDGQKIKTKIEDDGRLKLEIENKKLKIKFEDGKFRVEHESEGSESGQLNDKDKAEIEDKIEQEFEYKGIEVASSSGGLTIKKNNIRARTQFPLSINPETNELVVTTPAGQKAVTVLPDKAVENMLKNQVLTDINQEEGQDDINIEQRNDELVYKVQGEKDHKFLGFIPLKTAITAFVSAQTGELTAQEQSLLSRIISQLSS